MAPVVLITGKRSKCRAKGLFRQPAVATGATVIKTFHEFGQYFSRKFGGARHGEAADLSPCSLR
jgi:hypothetical protein